MMMMNCFCGIDILYCGVFSDRETSELAIDPCKIIGILKIYYNALVNPPVIIRFLLNVFSCRFSLCYMMIISG